MNVENFSSKELTESPVNLPGTMQNPESIRPVEYSRPELMNDLSFQNVDIELRPQDISELELMQPSEIPDTDVYDYGSFSEASLAEPEIVDVPEIGEAYVYGNPFEAAEVMCGEQGNNELMAEGDCGIVSVANIVRLSGDEVSENDAVLQAYDLGIVDPHDVPAERGGTTVMERQALLKSYEIESSILGTVDLDLVAKYVEGGYGVNMSVNAGKAWGIPEYIGNPDRPNHSIILTGTVRDMETCKLRGFYVCDSGTGENVKFMSVEQLEEAYTKSNGQLLVTNEPIR